MSELRIPRELGLRTLKAGRSADGELGRASTGEPQAGELWTTAGPVRCEWLVVEVDDPVSGRLRVVPVDLDPRLGAADLAIGEGVARDSAAAGSVGRLSVRCALAARVDSAVFSAGNCGGRLSAVDLERVRQRLADGGEELTAGWRQRQTELEPGYWELIAELEQARRELVEPRQRPDPSAKGVIADATSRNSSRHRWALAAMVLLALAAGYWIGSSTSPSKPAEELLDALVAEPLVDLPQVYFPAVGGLRGPARSLEISAATRLCLLVAAVPEPRLLDGYRVELVEALSEELIWSHDGVRAELGELRLALPVALLPAGEYRLRISNSAVPDAPELLLEHRLQVSVVRGRRPP